MSWPGQYRSPLRESLSSALLDLFAEFVSEISLMVFPPSFDLSSSTFDEFLFFED